jgi:hypothetical protein
MGASGWIYFTPYNPDTGVALQQLHVDNAPSPEEYAELLSAQINMLKKSIATAGEWAPAGMDEELQDQLTWRLEGLEELPQPKTTEQLIEQYRYIRGEEGTHSILDITRISDKSETCAATPFSEQELLELFGTTRPTRELVQQQRDKVMDARRSGSASYAIVYKDGVPDELCFAAFTGD